MFLIPIQTRPLAEKFQGPEVILEKLEGPNGKQIHEIIDIPCINIIRLNLHFAREQPIFFQSRSRKYQIMGSDVVMVDGIPFPPEISNIPLLGSGITDIEVHFLQIKYNAIGVYLEESVVEHLGNWKGKASSELAENDDFFEALASAPVEKYIRVVVIKEIKGSQYGVQLESAIRDRLAAIDKYEDEEEEAVEKVADFFQSKYFKPNWVITFHFSATPLTAEITFATEGKDEVKLKVENTNVAEMMLKWYLGGTRGVSQSTVKSVAEKLAEKLAA